MTRPTITAADLRPGCEVHMLDRNSPMGPEIILSRAPAPTHRSGATAHHYTLAAKEYPNRAPRIRHRELTDGKRFRRDIDGVYSALDRR